MYLISFAGVVLAIILNLSQVFHFIQTIWKLIVPFLVGFCIAFVLNIITKQLENTLLKNSKNKSQIPQRDHGHWCATACSPRPRKAIFAFLPKQFFCYQLYLNPLFVFPR